MLKWLIILNQSVLEDDVGIQKLNEMALTLLEANRNAKKTEGGGDLSKSSYA